MKEIRDLTLEYPSTPSALSAPSDNNKSGSASPIEAEPLYFCSGIGIIP